MKWKSLHMPKNLEVDEQTLTDSYGKFEIQPLERGFGITLGNALRRVLLSSIQGAAIDSIKVENIHHEFSTVPGVVEDIPEIILDGENNMTAFPNPAADKQIVKFYSDYISAKINLINSIGSIVYSDIINTQPFSKNEYTIDLSRVTTGTYFIQVISGSKIYFCPIVVWR